MGNCVQKSKISTAEIVPQESVKVVRPTVRLHGSTTSIVTAYIRFALLHKAVPHRFVPTEAPSFGSEAPMLQVGSETVRGSRETLLGFINSRFPDPPLTMPDYRDDTMPLIVRVVGLQHKSMLWHVQRMVRWAEDLAARGGKGSHDPTMGSPRMEIKKFGKSYSELLELMLEHAQMEERVVFPVLDTADRGICKAANEEHARHLPIMNGIKEDVKSVGVLDSGSPVYQEALSNLSSRLKSLQEHFKQHFAEEDRDLLPLMEAVELSKEQQKRVMEQCLDVMQGSHSHLLNFFLEGLIPTEAMHYLDLIAGYSAKGRLATVLRLNVD